MKLKIITWIFLLKDNKILFINKKNSDTNTESFSIPYISTDNVFLLPKLWLNHWLSENLWINIEQDNMINSFFVTKINKETNKKTIWIFFSCVNRNWEIKIENKNINDIWRFSKDNLPENMTYDMKLIVEKMKNKEKYTEYLSE